MQAKAGFCKKKAGFFYEIKFQTAMVKDQSVNMQRWLEFYGLKDRGAEENRLMD